MKKVFLILACYSVLALADEPPEVSSAAPTASPTLPPIEGVPPSTEVSGPASGGDPTPTQTPTPAPTPEPSAEPVASVTPSNSLVRIGVELGAFVANALGSSPIGFYSELRSASTAKLFVDFAALPYLLFETGIAFTTYNAAFSYTSIGQATEYSYSAIEVPLLAKFRLIPSKPVRPVLYAGISSGFRISARAGYGDISGSTSPTLINSVGGVGIEIQIGRSHALVGCLESRTGLNNLSTARGVTVYVRSLGVTAGYAFGF